MLEHRPMPDRPGARLTALTTGPDADRLDLSCLPTADGPERWSDGGVPAIYLATDLGVLMAEWGRHLDLTTAEPMAFWSVRVRLARPVDARQSLRRRLLHLLCDTTPCE